MKFALRKIHHLIRYFLVFGIITFAGYIKQLQDKIFLFLIAPVLYIAHAIRAFISANVTPLPSTDLVNYYFFLLPVCLAYYGFVGFQLKQLWNERGKIKFLILFTFLGFLIYVHRLSAKNLAVYLYSN